MASSMCDNACDSSLFFLKMFFLEDYLFILRANSTGAWRGERHHKGSNMQFSKVIEVVAFLLNSTQKGNQRSLGLYS